ncbi:MAG TPA: sugar phosphate isomerase/epimerase family protein [bacterium]|nr:sugar phosphate isomerase/epimerase family protein [bacterium]
MKISFQEGLIPFEDTAGFYRQVKQWGFDGVEAWGVGLEDRVAEVAAEAKAAGLQVSAICPGLDGIRGSLLSDDAEERARAMGDIKKLLRCGAELGGAGLNIVPEFGAVKFMKLYPELEDFDKRKGRFADELAPAVKEAEKLGTPILLEPLNRYEAFFLITVDQAAELCREFPGGYVKILADFFHMNIEETSTIDSLKRNVKHIGHVHLADSNRKLPGQGQIAFGPALSALKASGYEGFASMECSVSGDPATVIPESVSYLRKFI